MPPAFRNHLVPTGCDTPASSAASSLLSPVAIARQNLICSSRPAAGGRPGEGNGARPDRADRRFRMLIATSNFRVLRRPFESALDHIARVVREARPDLIPTTKRGSGASEMTEREAANLLLATNGADVAKDASVAVDRFRSLRFHYADPRELQVGTLQAISNSKSFGEALETLIAGMPEIIRA